MYYPPIENNFLRSLWSRRENIKDQNVVNLLLFIFPIFAVTARHWLSSLFGVIALYSLVLLFSKKSSTTDLQRDEKILLWAFGIYFFVFILTSVVNGWGDLQTRYFSVEIRFLLFIPVYLLIRQTPEGAKWLLLGAACSLVVTFGDSVKQVYLAGEDRYSAIYGPLFTGPITVLMAVFLISYLDKLSSVRGKLILSGVIMASVIPVILTDARSAYFAVPILIIIAFLNSRGIKRFVIPLLVIFTAALLYVSVDRVSQRVEVAYKEYTDYMSYSNPVKKARRLTSTGIRLEMWRATPYFFKDNPIFGVGRGNYVSNVKKYVAAKKVHKDIAKHAHPHNVFSEMLISKGLLGLFAFLGITLLPLGMLVRDYKRHRNSAVFGILLISGYLFFSLTDASTFIKGNYIAFFVVCLSVFFSYHIREKQNQTE